ncbi:MAG: D-alanyl-D-alanine carboxypeptidase, partial [Gammaproteobacteria bacterium]|nr:D-alanyl-D-alanine carboxypeptidase [Gammaproteobacteria bacterium]
EILLKGMIIQSGNDASVALAEHVAGSESAFADLMNHHAKKLGMASTHFENSTGMPGKNHITTPRDMATLAIAVIREFPEYYKWYSEKKYTYNKITQYNRNKLLWRNKFVDGVKTGHTESAGYNLVTSALQNNMRLVTVVMGTKSEDARATESQKLLNYGYRFYETHKLYDAGIPIAESKIWKGTDDQLPLGIKKDLYITIGRGQYKKLNAEMNMDAQITAPAQKGQQYGTLNISIENEQLKEVPLVALENVTEGSVWKRIYDSTMLIMQ